MRLWGKVVSGMMLFIAAVFVVVSIFVPEARWASVVIVIILIVLARLGVPALVRLFSFFTGDEEILTNGVVGSATITSLEPTGWRYNRQYPIVKFNLNVEAGGAAYPVGIRQVVDPELLQRLAAGTLVRVRVDRENHKKVVIDWREPIRTVTEGG